MLREVGTAQPVSYTVSCRVITSRHTNKGPRALLGPTFPFQEQTQHAQQHFALTYLQLPQATEETFQSP